MPRAQALAVVVLLLSYGAVWARQPAVRAAVPLPVPAPVLAAAADLPSADPSTLLTRIVRLMNDDAASSARPASGQPGPSSSGPDSRRRAAIRNALWTTDAKTGDTVMLPLDTAIWRETIFRQQVADRDLVAAILADQRAALLYYGLAALDDETLAWLGPDRETLQHLLEHAPIFAAFGRSIRVSGGHVAVPGGKAAEGVWTNLTGVDPARPTAFVQRIFRDRDGRLAFLYDAVAHLDRPRQRFALGLHLPESSRDDRLRALLDGFVEPAWQPFDRPFSRPLLDGAAFLSAIAVTGRGVAAGPMSRGIWERVFDDTSVVSFSAVETEEIAGDAGASPVDAAWLAQRISRVPETIGRRRLDTVLFAQRVFRDTSTADAASIATALRGFAYFPALMLSLERMGIAEAATFARAARHAARLDEIESADLRRTSITAYQSAIGLVERAHRAGVLSSSTSEALVDSLSEIDVSADGGYTGRLAEWLRADLLRALPIAKQDSPEPAESAVLSAIAGVEPAEDRPSAIMWADAHYRGDRAGAELRRLQRVRIRQGGLSLDGALAELATCDDTPQRRRERLTEPERALAETLASILYAAYLSEPDGPGVTTGNVALRHDLGRSSSPASRPSRSAWEPPVEDFTAKGGWRVRGSLLGLDAAFASLAFHR